MKVLILSVAVLVLLVYLTRRKKTINNILLTLTSTLFLLVAAEAIYRWFFKPPEVYNSLYATNENLEYDSILNYKMKAGVYKAFATLHKSDTLFNTSYTIIKDSLNKTYTFDHRAGYKSPKDSAEVVFVGCSFTFGEGVADSSTLPYLVGRQANVSTVNLGVSGYGIHQIYENYITRFSDQNNSNRIFVYSLLSDHFLRANAVYSWNNTGPFFVVQNDSLIQTGRINNNEQPNNYSWVEYASLHGNLGFIRLLGNQVTLKNNLKAFNDSDYKRYFLMIEKMKQMAEKTGGRFILVHYDNANWGQWGVDFPFQQTFDNDIRSLKNKGFNVLAVPSIVDFKDQSLLIPTDGHPNSKLYKQVANHLVPMLKRD